jgi:hypothetical protein
MLLLELSVNSWQVFFFLLGIRESCCPFRSAPISYIYFISFDTDLIHWFVDAGDQGFLNSYYADFANSRVYDPNTPLTPEPETQRLSTLYNADVGLYMLANKVIL